MNADNHFLSLAIVLFFLYTKIIYVTWCGETKFRERDFRKPQNKLYSEMLLRNKIINSSNIHIQMQRKPRHRYRPGKTMSDLKFGILMLITVGVICIMFVFYLLYSQESLQ